MVKGMGMIDEAMRNMWVVYGGALLVLLDELFIGLWYFVDYIFILIRFMIMIWLNSTLYH